MESLFVGFFFLVILLFAGSFILKGLVWALVIPLNFIEAVLGFIGIPFKFVGSILAFVWSILTFFIPGDMTHTTAPSPAISSSYAVHTSSVVQPSYHSQSFSQDASECHPSYPDVCIPVREFDLNCSDISYKRFQVTGYDVYGFDRDHDGIGCEK